MTFSDGGFMGYYIGQTKYEILSLTANRMMVRAVMGGNNSLAWYHILSTSPPVQPSQDFTNLVFFDEFDAAGAPNPAKWTYDLGRNNGWGNNEEQNYTNSPTNVVVANGVLKITAKKEPSGGAQYSSARLKSDGIYSFKYGKAVIRAKLPTGAGTWPAIWMLGQNYTTNTWPACGEIDIMEHVGNQQNKIFNTLHYPGNFGGSATGNAGAFTNPTASTAFHDYSVIWTASSIKFYVDNTLSYTFINNAGLPFNANFFFILNVAMGGSFGGAITPAFTESSMEIDYVRVYQ
jgi:beta-glucanase (GH16 family)